MNKTIYTLLTIIFLSCITTNANAIKMKGGVVGCGKWIAYRENKTPDMSDESLGRLYTAWILGFLSGSAVQTNKDILKNTDNESLYLWIDNYCRANPLKFIPDASDALFEELKKQEGFK
jgi:hypothetical protein